MTLTAAEIVIANQSLAKIGAKSITLAVQTSPEGVQANLHYEQTRDSLLESFEWKFASGREILAQTGAPAFEWDHQYVLPNDFLRLKVIAEIDDGNDITDRFTIEGNKILTNEDTVSILYVRKITDVSEFSPMFIELLVNVLALKLLHPLSGSGSGMMNLRESILKETNTLQFRARAIEKQQVNVTGRRDWNQARFRTGRFLDV